MKTILVWATVLLGLFALSSCGEFKGDTGDTGETGQAGQSLYAAPTGLSVTISSVTVPDAGTPVVAFTVKDQDGNPYAFLKSGDVSFTFAQLLPAGSDASHWQSYINQTETVGSSGPGTPGKTATQATTESNGTLTNNNDGSYSYTFKTIVTSVTSPITVAYDATLTHRLGLQLFRSDLPTVNEVYDFQPSTGNRTGITTRNIVITQSCNYCHGGSLQLHGGRRIDTLLCVTCHNPGTSDANSGNTVDFKVMIHKIHRGKELPSVVAGGSYAIYGFGNAKHDYSKIGLPMDILNCTKCHDSANPATADGGNWATMPTIEACTSCHDDIVSSTGAINSSHKGGAGVANGSCIACHQTGGAGGDIAAKHSPTGYTAGTTTFPNIVDSASYQFNVLSVSDVAVGKKPSIKFSVTNPKTGSAWDLKKDKEWTNGSMTMMLGWNAAGDYTNENSGEGLGQPVRISNLTTSGATDNGDFTYTATSGVALPTGYGALAVAIYGRAAAVGATAGTYNVQVPVKSSVDYVSGYARRDIVDTARCLNCHVSLSLHGTQRTNNTRICVICHNPNATDLPVRPNNAPFGTVDGKKEEPVDFKRMIHGIHAADFRSNPLTVYGFGGSANTYGPDDVHFPGVLNNCETCHIPGTYELPISTKALGSTVNSDPLLATKLNGNVNTTSLLNPDDDLNITPTAAACSSCHDKDSAKNHMGQNGADFSIVQGNIDTTSANTEACVTCHGPGRVADVKTVHGIN